MFRAGQYTKRWRGDKGRENFSECRWLWQSSRKHILLDDTVDLDVLFLHRKIIRYNGLWRVVRDQNPYSFHRFVTKSFVPPSISNSIGHARTVPSPAIFTVASNPILLPAPNSGAA